MRLPSLGLDVLNGPLPTLADPNIEALVDELNLGAHDAHRA